MQFPEPKTKDLVQALPVRAVDTVERVQQESPLQHDAHVQAYYAHYPHRRRFFVDEAE